MTDLERYHDTTPVVVDHQSAAVQRLSEWAHSATAAAHIADQLVRSSFVPESFRGKPHEATAAILAGIEVGLQPMAALRSFDVIQGQAAARAVTLRAIVQSQGHEIELVESTTTRCKMRGRRKGSDGWQEVLWTMDRAKQLRLTGKPNWQNQPQTMLVARATSELARLIASDAILGIAYSVEELADGAGAGVEVPAMTGALNEGATPGTKRMSRKGAAAPVDVESTEELPDPDAITDAQVKKMAVQFREAGISDRADRIDYISATIGRVVTSSKELTKVEGSQVIEALVALAASANLAAPVNAEIVEGDPSLPIYEDES